MPFNDAALRGTVDKHLASPPKRTQKLLTTLRASVRAQVPPRRVDENLLLCTWNIRAFGDLNDAWRSGPDDSPRRDLEALRCIAEIVSHFDVIAVQEVKSNLKALRHLMKALGPDWGFILTDVNAGRPGNDERMAFIFDLRRAKPSGLAGELSLTGAHRPGLSPDRLRAAMAEDFARHPYAVSFRSGSDTLVLVALHVLYGKVQGRVHELRGIADAMYRWADAESAWGQNLIVLGDMNIDREGDAGYQAFTETGLRPPDELRDAPRTIFHGDGKGGFYDQIAWFHQEDGRGRAHRPVLSMRYSGKAGYVDFTSTLLHDPADPKEREDLSWRISDHYPLWAEFQSGTPSAPDEGEDG